MNHPTLSATVFSEEVFSLPPLVTIVIEKSWLQVSPEERTQLSKILNAVRLSLDSVRIVSQSEFDLAKLGPVTQVIVFGLSLKGVNPYELITVKDTRLVMSEGLSALLTNDQAKKMLWLALKPLFGL